MPTSSRSSLASSRSSLVASGAAIALVLGLAGTASATARPAADGLAAPTALATTASTLFVANHATSTLTLLNAASGAFEGIVSARVLGVHAPTAMAASAAKSWHTVLVASAGGANRAFAVTPKGSGVRLRALSTRPFAGCAKGAAVALSTDAAGQFVALCSNGVVDVYDGRTAALVRTLPASTTHLAAATALSVVGGAIYVTVSAAGASPAPSAVAHEGVYEVSLATGAPLASITNATCASCGFLGPDGIAFSQGQLWVADATNSQATELATGPMSFLATQTSNLYNTGAVLAYGSTVFLASPDGPGSSMVTRFSGSPSSFQWMMCNTNGPYRFDNPSSLVIANGDVLNPRVLWVANPADNLLDEMDVTTGALVRTVS